MAKMKIGLIVNPIAGMGGSVGLKGTDGDMYQKALELGAEPITPGRTRDFLNHLDGAGQITFLTAPGQMGGDFLKEFNFDSKIIGNIGNRSTNQDTKDAAISMLDLGADLLVFIGGDGTARDIVDAVGEEIPVVAVPSGVKMYSSAFALNPRAAAEMVTAYLEGTEVMEEEVLDIDEQAFREDRLASELYGYLKVPRVQQLIQGGKIMSNLNAPIQEIKSQIGTYIVEEKMEPDRLYLLGPGTTVRAVMEKLNLEKTLLGVDAVVNHKLAGKDLNEKQILKLIEQYPEATIIVTPIGGNGFIFGRGSKQFTPEVIQRVGREQIWVLATRSKLNQLTCLRVDTGDPEVDQMLSGYLKVTVNYLEGKVVKVTC